MDTKKYVPIVVVAALTTFVMVKWVMPNLMGDGAADNKFDAGMDY